jgi:hypothetical protein
MNLFLWRSKAAAKREAQRRMLIALVIAHEERAIRLQSQINRHLEVLAALDPDGDGERLRAQIANLPEFDQTAGHVRDLPARIAELKKFFEP